MNTQEKTAGKTAENTGGLPHFDPADTPAIRAYLERDDVGFAEKARAAEISEHGTLFTVLIGDFNRGYADKARYIAPSPKGGYREYVVPENGITKRGFATYAEARAALAYAVKEYAGGSIYNAVALNVRIMQHSGYNKMYFLDRAEIARAEVA